MIDRSHADQNLAAAIENLDWMIEGIKDVLHRLRDKAAGDGSGYTIETSLIIAGTRAMFEKTVGANPDLASEKYVERVYSAMTRSSTENVVLFPLHWKVGVPIPSSSGCVTYLTLRHNTASIRLKAPTSGRRLLIWNPNLTNSRKTRAGLLIEREVVESMEDPSIVFRERIWTVEAMWVAIMNFEDDCFKTPAGYQTPGLCQAERRLGGPIW